MPTSIENVAKLYSNIPNYEDTRLFTHPIEREITLRTIHANLNLSGSSPKRIADIGGGPGKLSFALADRGHRVDLVDLTPELIRLAQAEQEKRILDGNKALLGSIAIGNALDEPTLPKGSYDAVLLLGPLYHLLDESERVKAVDNAITMAKHEGGLVFCAFVSKEAHLRDLAVREPGRMVEKKEFYDKYLGDGRYEKVDGNRGLHVQSFHTHGSEIRNFFARHFANEVDLVELRSTEGILGGGLDAKLAEASDEIVKTWADLMFEGYSKDEEYLGCADHLLAVLRRK